MATPRIPKFDVLLYCQECRANVGRVLSVGDNNAGGRIEEAMRDHLLTEHRDILAAF